MGGDINTRGANPGLFSCHSLMLKNILPGCVMPRSGVRPASFQRLSSRATSIVGGERKLGIGYNENIYLAMG